MNRLSKLQQAARRFTKIHDINAEKEKHFWDGIESIAHAHKPQDWSIVASHHNINDQKINSVSSHPLMTHESIIICYICTNRNPRCFH